MATEIELPDGTILEAPDGVDPSKVAKAYLAKQRGAAPPVQVAKPPLEYRGIRLDQPPPAPAPRLPDLQYRGMGEAALADEDRYEAAQHPEHILGGAEGMAATATGIPAFVASGIPALAGTLLPGPPGQGANWQEKAQGTLTYPFTPLTGRSLTPAGQGMTEALTSPMAFLDKGATAFSDTSTARPLPPLPYSGLGEAAAADEDRYLGMQQRENNPLAAAMMKTTLLGGPAVLGGKSAMPAPAATLEEVLARSRGGDSAGAASAATDVSRASPELRAEILRAGRKGDINNEAIQRHIEAESLPVPGRLTAGEATLDPTLRSHELNLRGKHPEMAERMSESNRVLGENMQAVRDKAGPDVFTTNAVEHGDTLIKTYRDMDTAARGEIDQAYKAARDANGGDLPMDGKSFVAAADQALKSNMKGRYVPAEVAADLAEIRDTGAMTFETFENLRTNLAEESRTAANGNVRAAVRIVRDALEKIEPMGRAAEVKPLFDRARSLAKARFDRLDADPAYSAAVDRSVSPDQFVSKFVIRAPRDDVATLMKAIGNDPVARQTVSVAVLDYLRDAARLDRNYSGNFSAAGFSRALNALDPKANLIFDPATAETLGNIHGFAHNTTFQPRGHSINNSNTLVGALAKPMLSEIPYLGKVIEKTAGKLQTRRLINSSLRPGAGIAAPRGITRQQVLADQLRK